MLFISVFTITKRRASRSASSVASLESLAAGLSFGITHNRVSSATAHRGGAGRLDLFTAHRLDCGAFEPALPVPGKPEITIAAELRLAHDSRRG